MKKRCSVIEKPVKFFLGLNKFYEKRLRPAVTISARIIRVKRHFVVQSEGGKNSPLKCSAEATAATTVNRKVMKELLGRTQSKAGR